MLRLFAETLGQNIYICRMYISYSEEEYFIFQKISESAADLKMDAFVIGGFVRDKILQRPTKDADIVCMGDGIALAKKVAQKFHPAPEVTVFKNFGTGQIKISLESLPAFPGAANSNLAD